MSAPKLKAKDLSLCKKCGNVMINRRMRTNNSKEIEFKPILQCIICRHWTENNYKS